MSVTTTVERSHTRRDEAAAGARAMVPWLLGVAPYGLVIGVTAAQADIPTAAGWPTGLVIFSGSAQVATIELLDAGAASLVVVATALAINARAWSSTRGRLPVTGATRPAGGARWPPTCWWTRRSPWVSTATSAPAIAVERTRTISAARSFSGSRGWRPSPSVPPLARLPAGLHLEFMIPLFLVGEVVVRLSTPAMWRTALTAVAVALVGYSAPFQLGLMGAVLAGIAVGVTTPRDSR